MIGQEHMVDTRIGDLARQIDDAQITSFRDPGRLNDVTLSELTVELVFPVDDETRSWCETTLEALRQTEQQQSQQLAILREEYRKLAVQDMLYRALNEPDGDTFQQAHEALMELSATVETEKSINSIPKLLNLDMHPRLTVLSEKDSEKIEQK